MREPGIIRMGIAHYKDQVIKESGRGQGIRSIPMASGLIKHDIQCNLDKTSTEQSSLNFWVGEPFSKP